MLNLIPVSRGCGLFRFGSALVALTLVLAGLASGCGTSSDKTGADTSDKDLGASQEVLSQDAGADTRAAGDLAQDLTPEVLPNLPADKTFTTRYVAGAAIANINPDHDTFMGGYGLCQGNADLCRYSEGIHDDVTVQAVALGDTTSGEVVIFVGVDSVGLVRFDLRQVEQAAPAAFAERFGVSFQGERLLVGASHAHSTTDTIGLWGPMDGKVREEDAYVAFIRETILSTALDAFGNLGDVELVWGKGTFKNNSDDVFADDEDLFVLRGTRPGGEGVFTLTRYPGHPTVYSANNNGISADWVGPFRKKMGEELGGVPVFINGPIGSVYPSEPDCEVGVLFPDGWVDPDVSESDHRKVGCTGYSIAQVALDALAAGSPVEDTGIVFRHTDFQFHPTNQIMSVLIEIGPIPIELPDVSDPDSLMTSCFSWVTLGQLNYISTPGESFPDFAAHISTRMQSSGVENPIVLGLTHDWMGYLLAEEQWEDPELGYHRSLSPGETVEPAFLEALQTMLDQE